MKSENYSLGTAQSFPQAFDGTAMVFHKIERIPPHIALIHNGFYYSLSVKGTRLRIPFDVFYEETMRLKSSCVMVEIHVPFYIADPDAEFSSLPPLSAHNFITCLTPIKEWLINGTDEDLSERLIEAEFAFDVIEVLKQEGCIKEIYAAFLQQPNIELPRYTLQDIMEEINRKETGNVNR